MLVAGVTRAGLEEALLGTGSRCALASSGLGCEGGAAAALPPCLSARCCRFCVCARFENAGEVLKTAQRLKSVFLAAVPASFGCGTFVGSREMPSPEQR